MTNVLGDIEAMRPEQATHVASVLAAAFGDDPIFAWCIPDPSLRLAVLPRFFELAVRSVADADEIEVLTDGLGAALWVPPLRPTVLDEEMDAFADEIGALIGDGVDRTFALMEMLDAIHPTEPHRFLWFLGVAPSAQGFGRGAALLRSMLRVCDRDDVPAGLDATSPANRRLYERHGFRVVSEHSVADSPTMWSMWRLPTTQPVADQAD